MSTLFSITTNVDFSHSFFHSKTTFNFSFELPCKTSSWGAITKWWSQSGGTSKWRKNMFLNQPCVKFWHLQNDIHQTFGPTISHSKPKFEAILLTKCNMYDYNNNKKKHVGDQNFIALWFLKLLIEDRSNFALNLTLQAINFQKTSN